MKVLGEDITYGDLVATSGLAFRMQVHKKLCPSSPHSFCGYRCGNESDRALAWDMRVFDIMSDDKKVVAEVRQTIADSIDRGVPVQYSREEDGIIVG